MCFMLNVQFLFSTQRLLEHVKVSDGSLLPQSLAMEVRSHRLMLHQFMKWKRLADTMAQLEDNHGEEITVVVATTNCPCGLEIHS